MDYCLNLSVIMDLAVGCFFFKIYWTSVRRMRVKWGYVEEVNRMILVTNHLIEWCLVFVINC